MRTPYRQPYAYHYNQSGGDVYGRAGLRPVHATAYAKHYACTVITLLEWQSGAIPPAMRPIPHSPPATRRCVRANVRAVQTTACASRDTTIRDGITWPGMRLNGYAARIGGGGQTSGLMHARN